MIRLVLTTLANAEDAASIIRTLVAEKLAACGTILPGARSIYQWEGKLEDATEAVVLLKTTEALAPELAARLAALHPYTIPEIITLSPESVAPAYAAWLRESCAR